MVFLPAPPEERQVNFEYSDPKAKAVWVAGSFNYWNPKASPLRNLGAGRWGLQLTLEPGRYEYRFLVDRHWTIDPAARQQVTDFCGGVNSVLVVE
jgi:1,4-alpha-glucan branching enzyme